MPLYEYYCADCKIKFEALRRMSQADDPIACVRCQGTNTSRLISVFAAISKGSSGESRSLGGSSGCASCSATSCAACSSG
ncbi:MAG: zinc ribbon domain-containing protein [Chloroflexi bacterium]|nr:zinc ribbon domain-containing protein [Chloroflexota bacterium]